ncbi:MAG TPA: ribose ABC transporter permease, partial [Anaeromyxobacter sp.]|nr:ribose ABC transporter permease [Anaeromyxobacter sp.]
MRLDAKRVLKNYGFLIAFIAVCAILSVLSPVFLTRSNILNVVKQSSVFGIMAVGMTFVILTGGIDLSVGSILAFAGAVAAGMLKAGAPISLVMLASLGIGAVLGLANGLVITLGRITPFVTTLAMMSIARSLTLIYTNGYPISGFHPGFRFLGGGDLLGIPFPIVVFVAT